MNVEYANGNCYFSIGLLLLPLLSLPRLGMLGLVFHILLHQTERK